MDLIKIANLAEQRQQFLQEHNIDDVNVFRSDPAAKKKMNGRKQQAERQIREYFLQQEKVLGSSSSELKQMERKMIKDLNDESNQSVLNFSIDRTRQVASENPNQFKRLSALSEDSEGALGKSHAKELGGALGAIGGAGLGLLAGRRLPKKNTGLLQQIGGALTGGAVGGVTAGSIGSIRDERRTGYNHEDVLKPYQIADRITNRKKFQ